MVLHGRHCLNGTWALLLASQSIWFLLMVAGSASGGQVAELGLPGRRARDALWAAKPVNLSVASVCSKDCASMGTTKTDWKVVQVCHPLGMRLHSMRVASRDLGIR